MPDAIMMPPHRRGNNITRYVVEAIERAGPSATADGIAEVVIAGHIEEFKDWAYDLARARVRDIARREFRQQALSEQYVLEGVAGVPGWYSVPADPDDDDPEGQRDRYVRIQHITGAELRRSTNRLFRQIEADSRRAGVQLQLLELFEARGGRDDQVVAEVLAGRAAA